MRLSIQMPNLYIIAGCNGAGKTTASYTILPEMLNCEEFVNADSIAAGLSPFNPDSGSLGYKITLVYFWLSSPDEAKQRVATRMEKGVHYIPDDVIKRRRYYAGIMPFIIYTCRFAIFGSS